MLNISVKVDPETLDALARLARERNESRSEVIRAAIAALAEQEKVEESTTFAKVKHLIGCVSSSGASDARNIGRQFADDLVRRRRGRSKKSR